MRCPECNAVCWRNEIDVGVGIVSDEWKCTVCEWDENQACPMNEENWEDFLRTDDRDTDMPNKDGRALERKYEKVTCERCKGTGALSKKDGGIHTLSSDRRRKPRCSACQGWGYNIIGTIEEPYEDAK